MGGGFTWPSGGPFPPHSLELTICCSHQTGEEDRRSHWGLEVVQGCMGSGDRGQDTVMRALWEQEGLWLGWGGGCD